MRNLDIDKSICNWIKNNQFSRLDFLDEDWQSNEHKKYMGYYFFVLDLKGESNDFVLDELITREGSKANALIYLGNIANKIYDNRRNQIALSFYRKALEEDSNNSEAHWTVYFYTYCIENFLTAIKIDYENKKYNNLNLKVNNFYSFDEINNLSSTDLELFKNILTDSNIKETNKIRSILSKIYSLFDDWEIGLKYIQNSEKINFEVVKTYYEKGLITLEMAISKLHSFEIEMLIGDDPQKIYEMYVEESKNEESQLTNDFLISKAYKAEQYHDVIKFFEKTEKSNKIIFSLDIYLMYLISQIELKLPVNQEELNYVLQRCILISDISQESEDKLLYFTLMIKLQLIKIESEIAVPNTFNLPLSMYESYIKAQKILELPEIVKSSEYEKLKKTIIELKTKMDNSQKQQRYNNHLESFYLENYDHDSLLDYCNLCIEFESYDEVINNLKKFHEKNTPSMSTYNCLGVAHQYKGEFTQALECFKLALEKMKSSKENDFIVIHNYIYTFKKIDNKEISDEEFNELKKLMNLSLTNSFKWSDFITDRFNTLYKYSPFNVNTIDALTNQYFFLPSKKLLNDPIELPDLSKIRPDTHIFENYNICSFSNNENSMLMWSHYAQQHEGIMVEYFFGGELPSGYGISKVSYADDEKRFKDKDEFIFNQFLLTKNKDWSYENEVRLFTFLNNKVEFDTYKYPNPDRTKINASIQSITLGLKFPEEKKKLIGIIVNTLNARKLPHEDKIKVKQAFLCDNNNYSLEYRELFLD
ncbi:DUF2971 domain-containing protein [Acinetobacter baumannii]|uniref:DUF2971 domain-containing protein n=1 Tax=Acinetobacter baumannii TaxID=470 RepID=UPI0025A5D965|nr:DUF2971 domain-containing protein [Acinetobacter baumannii]MDM8491363.1 DUF2971 domain-containing protein [Acinetobacter baumannii]MDM8501629.1 DUF2971 domain-containing protein [Acinetobacter baumannii]MDM8505619.1 DUF2971 domain-containing protein [Acinetobacter baumannii]MDM8508957.1 DUF2971 domain-containing protein [Acinetobacter baumannii]MDM8513490.1 DUF2971 domain-containing protein [Acinetobacter baumannii]